MLPPLEHRSHIRHRRGIKSREVKGGETTAVGEHRTHTRHRRGIKSREVKGSEA